MEIIRGMFFALILNSQNVQQGGAVSFIVGITTLDNRLLSYNLFFGEGAPVLGTTNNLNQNFQHSYLNGGTYTALLSVIDGPNVYSLERTITVNSLNQLGANVSSLLVSLLSPANNVVLSSSGINFSYKANGPGSLSNCTFNLYYYNNSNFGSLVYTYFNNTIVNNQISNVALSNFDNGDYSWEVECLNNQGNYDVESRDFEYYVFQSFNSTLQQSLSFNNTFEKSEEIEDILSAINSFLDNLEDSDQDVREVVEDMGIEQNLLGYKKRVLQIKQDLQENLGYSRDPEKKEKRRQEIYQELEDMRDKIPDDIEVIVAREFLKNGIDSDIKDVIKKYVDAKKMTLSRSSLKKFIKYNENLQKDFSVLVKLKNVIIHYRDREEKITLATKSPNFKDKDFEINYLEIIPGEALGKFDNIIWVSKQENIINNELALIKDSDLTEERLIYYFDSLLDLEDLKKSDTIVFSEDFPKDTNIFTAFAVFFDATEGSEFTFYFIWSVFILLFIAGGFYSVRVFKTKRYRDSRDVRIILDLVQNSEYSLDNGDLVKAENNYLKIQDKYKSLLPEAKKVVYDKINRLVLEVDKSEVSILAKECLAALTAGRKKDACFIYNKIQPMYNRMPDKYKNKIYEKLRPYFDMLRF